MDRSEAVSIRMADKLFAGRRGHGSTERIVERHLRYEELKGIVKVAYELGHQDAAKEGQPMVEKKPEGPSSPDRLIHCAINDVLDILKDCGVKEGDRSMATELVVNALRNVMSVSDTTRLLDEIKRRRHA